MDTPLTRIPIARAIHFDDCSQCAMRNFYLPAGLSAAENKRVDALVKHHLIIKAGDTLYRTGEPSEHFYPIKHGVMKTLTHSNDGTYRIVGFYLAGEVLSLDSIATGIHHADAVAIADTDLCVIDKKEFRALGREIPALLDIFLNVLGDRINYHQHRVSLMGLKADQKIASVCLLMGERLEKLGFDKNNYDKPLNQIDLGNFLGISPETVSRMFSKLMALKLISLIGDRVIILDRAALSVLAGRIAAPI